MSAREIKELCIAREALSRFPSNENTSYRLEELVDIMTTKLKDEVTEKPERYTKPPKRDLTDEIPF